jgi:hypothetical protein
VLNQRRCNDGVAKDAIDLSTPPVFSEPERHQRGRLLTCFNFRRSGADECRSISPNSSSGSVWVKSVIVGARLQEVVVGR